MKKVFPRWRRILMIAAIIYVIAGAALYFFQDKLLFHPQKLDAAHHFQFSQPFKEINLPVSEEKTLNIIQFTVPDSIRKGLVLYFHGNRQNVERYAPFADHFTRNGYEVWMSDYPGFGKTTGSRSEQALYEDAVHVYRLARSRIAKDSIVLYGKSIGTGIAAYLAANYDCKQLLLETPYYSIPALMRRYAFIYPVEWMSRYKLPVNEYLGKVNVPVTLLHGTDDGVIPFNHSKRLEAENKLAHLVTISGGSHNDLANYPAFQQAIDSLFR